MNQESIAIPPAASSLGISATALEDSQGLFSDKDISPVPSVDQKLFLVVSVALGTVSFFTNIVQVGVFLKPSALRSVKSILLLSQAVSGVFASFVIAFPIHVISARGGSAIGESGYNACYLGHSGIILVTVLTSLSTATMLLLHYYLTHNHPRKYAVAGSSLYGWAAIVGGVWVYAFAIAILPWFGWNSWDMHDAKCHLSTLWPLSFTTFLTFLVGLHMAATLFMWASSRTEHLKAASRRQNISSNRGCSVDAETAPIAPIIQSGSFEGRVSICGWAVTVSSIVPLLGHVVVASSCAASSLCLSSPHHYHEDEASLPWSSLLLTAAATANPLFYVFSDDQVSSTTLMILSRACCWWRVKNKDGVEPPRKETSVNVETNVYVTDDTHQLVGDNT